MGHPGRLTKKIVLVTRPQAQARSSTLALAKAGIKVVATPMIRIAPPSSFARLDAALHELSRYDGIIFTSRNAVDSFMKRAKQLRLTPLPKPRRLFAIGSETARALRWHGFKSATTPRVSRAEELAEAMGNVKGLRLLFPRAKIAREILPRLLRRRGARVSIVEAYQTLPDLRGARALRLAALKKIDAVTFTSGSAVREFVRQLGRAKTRKLFRQARAISIGPVTSQTLRAFAIKPAAQAKEATTSALAKAVIKLLV